MDTVRFCVSLMFVKNNACKPNLACTNKSFGISIGVFLRHELCPHSVDALELKVNLIFFLHFVFFRWEMSQCLSCLQFFVLTFEDASMRAENKERPPPTCSELA